MMSNGRITLAELQQRKRETTIVEQNMLAQSLHFKVQIEYDHTTYTSKNFHYRHNPVKSNKLAILEGTIRGGFDMQHLH
ncbi:hypothetical protein A0H81_09450 [Grifola frondosa]|uniref:Uncharacterized protein n=1 Tax=Grifola frondosa TaxID=5627 RepID=A0A1C7M1H7_GRIFR|nr:hypothetical protein A0H81_09450 [Grifola frondosa]